MATQVQWRGGSELEHSTFTGAPKEVTVDTTLKTLRVHDGSTVGGFPLARQDELDIQLSGIKTDFYGPTDPFLVVANGIVKGAVWADTTSQTIKRRNDSNTDWIIEGRLFKKAIPEFAVGDIPSSNQGLIVVSGKGIMEWDSISSSYKPLPSSVAVVKDSEADSGAALIPSGSIAERPSTATEGMFRYNSESGQFEGFQNGQWDQISGGDPLFSVMWWPERSAIPAGYVAADGQELSRLTYPDAWAGIDTNKVPTVADASWLSTPTERGKYTAGDGTNTFRLPDYNGKSAGSFGALFLRGDGTKSAGVAGEIQRDALQNITGSLTQVTGANPFSTSGTGAFVTNNGGSGGYDTVTGTYANVSFDASLVARTADETRSLNVTGCWVIKLFGAVVNVGSADAAQLASDYANLAATKLDVSAAYGANQDWVDETANRALNVLYTNSTGKIIDVIVSAFSSIANRFDLYINEELRGTIYCPAGQSGTHSFSVPNGKTCRCVMRDGGTNTLADWHEMKGV